MKSIIISKKLSIFPKDLTHNIAPKLLEIAKIQIENSCSEEYGYILSVNKITKIRNNIISPNTSNVIFDIDCEITCLKPEKGKQYIGNIIVISEHAIVLDIEGKFGVLVNMVNSDYKYDNTLNSFKK